MSEFSLFSQFVQSLVFCLYFTTLSEVYENIRHQKSRVWYLNTESKWLTVSLCETESVTSHSQINNTTSIIFFLRLTPTTHPPTSCYYKYLAEFSLLGHAVYYNPECQVQYTKSWGTQFMYLTTALPLLRLICHLTGSEHELSCTSQKKRELWNRGGACMYVSLWCNVVPVLKIRSHAAVWSRHILVLSLLWMCTGVTIITPNVLIICKQNHRRETY